MSNLYNAKVSFKGEGSFTFTMPYYGEVTIYAGKDIYMKNLTQQGVETLRSLRPVLLDHQLNAKSDGCYTYIDFNETNNIIPSKMKMNYREVVSNKSVAEMKAEMIKGPIQEEELSGITETPKEETSKIVEEKSKEEKVKNEIKPDDYVLTSTKHKGRKIKDLSKAQINGNIKRFNDKDLEMINLYLEK